MVAYSYYREFFMRIILFLTVEKIKRMEVKRLASQRYRVGHTQQADCLPRDVLTQRFEFFLTHCLLNVLYVVHNKKKIDLSKEIFLMHRNDNPKVINKV